MNTIYRQCRSTDRKGNSKVKMSFSESKDFADDVGKFNRNSYINTSLSGIGTDAAPTTVPRRNVNPVLFKIKTNRISS